MAKGWFSDKTQKSSRDHKAAVADKKAAAAKAKSKADDAAKRETQRQIREKGWGDSSGGKKG